MQSSQNCIRSDTKLLDASFEVHNSLAVVVAAVHFRVVLIEVSLGSECVFTLRPKRGVRDILVRIAMTTWKRSGKIVGQLEARSHSQAS